MAVPTSGRVRRRRVLARPPGPPHARTIGAYWDAKIAGNVERDRRADADLEARGWLVVRAWDFEIRKKPASVVERITDALQDRVNGTAQWHSRLTD